MRILLVADVNSWALDLTAKYIQKSIPCDIAYVSGEPRFNENMLNEYDHVHAMNWLDLQTLAGHPRVTAGVCSHGFELKWLGVARKELPKFKKLVCISKILYDRARKYNQNVHYISNGVDTELFKPSDKQNEVFTVGFCGQKTDGGFGEKKNKEKRPIWDVKGYELILQPLQKRLEGIVVFKVLTNDYTNAIPYEDMPKWYEDIDVLICTSLYEGCPFPVLEAGAYGKPVISTHVGIVPELVKHGTNGFRLGTVRSRGDIPQVIDSFEHYIIQLKVDSNLCKYMGNNMREAVMKWDWKYQIPKWKEFFGCD